MPPAEDATPITAPSPSRGLSTTAGCVISSAYAVIRKPNWLDLSWQYGKEEEHR
jgi:hypothetical protein